MKRHVARITGIIVFFALIAGANAQNIRRTLVKSGPESAVVRIDFTNYNTQTVNVDGEQMQYLSMDGAWPVLEEGAPELLQYTFSLIMPDDAQPEIEILDEQYSEITDFSLAPSKGSIMRNVNPDEVPFIKGESYRSREYLVGSPAKLAQHYRLRDFHGVAVKAYPFDYNPGSKTLRAYSSVTMKITYNGTSSKVSARKNNKTFDGIYSNHFLNYGSQFRSDAISEEGDILVIAPEAFFEAMQPYIDWKTRAGYNVEMVSVSEAGSNSTQIKSFISNYYGSHNLTFVVIVGDNTLFPAPVISGDYCDNYYTEIVGDDNYPDIILGKISAENADQVALQVRKFLEYEQNPTNTDHFPVFLGLASDDANTESADNGEYDWQHIRLINDKLMGFTYSSGYELFEGSRGGLDAAGDPTVAQVTTAVNSGVGIINYCGHGDWDRWSTTGFSNTNVNALANNGKLPFVISVACLNGQYYNRTCFAETWLRASNNGQPSGAVGFTGSTINQPWKEPMRAQDCMIDILVDSTNTQKKITFGGIFFNGMIGMLDVYPTTTTTNTFRTWILFGDPTLLLRTDIPQELTVDYQPVVLVGTQSVDFTSEVDNAKVALSKGGELVKAGTISGNSLQLELEETYTPTDTLFVTATAQNRIPYMGSITFAPNSGPYVICSNFAVSSNNGMAEYGESVTMAASFKNVGVQPAGNTQVKISTDDSYVTLTSSALSFANINPDETKTQDNAFSFTVSPAVPNNHVVDFMMIIVTPGCDTIKSSKKVKIFAPQPVFAGMALDDSQLGNGDSRLDFEESATVRITVRNAGNSKSKAGVLTVKNPAEDIEVSTINFDVPQLENSESLTFDCPVTVSSEIDETTITYIKATYTTGEYSVTEYFPVKIGAIVEDWETGDLTKMDWESNSATPWFVTAQMPYKGSYCIKSGRIANSASTSLQITSDSPVNDSISFYYKVSSESSDYLRFFIDGQKVGEWSGIVPWTRAAFPVDSGTHTYSWRYVKDFWWSTGSDCAWIDEIEFPAGKINSPVSIDNREDIGIRVMPNPASDYVYLDLTEEMPAASYRIFDLTGRLLGGGVLFTDRTKVSLVKYPEGVYIMEVLSANKVVKTQKIIKK